MKHARAAETQVLLEGVPLPAKRGQLLEYAARQGATPMVLHALSGIPGRLYRSLDEVGEELVRVQPVRRHPVPAPRTESGAPPGGPEYVNPRPESGAVRDDD